MFSGIFHKSYGCQFDCLNNVRQLKFYTRLLINSEMRNPLQKEIKGELPKSNALSENLPRTRFMMFVL